MASALDKLTAAKNSLTGDQVNLTVCKATNHDVLSPKRKHVEVLLAWSNNPNLSIPDLADRLFVRVADTNWAVVFKAMIVSHELMAKGGERFIQNLASRSSNFNVTAFLDKGNIVGYDMSPFIRRYGHYLNERALAYRQVGYDFYRLKKTAEGTELRTMEMAKLTKTLPVMQKLLDALVDFQVQQGELANGVINSAFLLMFKDLVRLFACYNDAVINLLEKFFDMKKPQAKEALDLYKRFLIRMDKVSEFLKVAENLGVGKEELPDLSKAPSSLLTALENHIQTMDKKPASPSRPALSGPSNVKVGSLVLPASTAAALGMPQDGSAAAASQTSPSLPPPGQGANAQVVADKKRQLEAERERLLALKLHAGSGSVSPSVSTGAMAGSAGPVNPLDDLSGLSFGGAATVVAAAGAFHSSVPHTAVGNDLYAQPMQAYAPAANPFMGGAPAASNNPFGSAGNDLFASSQAPALSTAGETSAPLGMGADILLPQVLGEFATKDTAPKQKGLGKDLDSSLSIAAESLTLSNGGQPMRKQQQFQPQPSAVRTGGSTWTPIQQTATVTPGPSMASGGWGAQPMQQQPIGQPAMGGQAFGGMQPMGGMQSMGGMQQPMGGMQQPMGGGFGMAAQPRPGFGMAGQQPMGGFPQQQQMGGFPQQSMSTAQDPFGPVPGTQGRF